MQTDAGRVVERECVLSSFLLAEKPWKALGQRSDRDSLSHSEKKPKFLVYFRDLYIISDPYLELWSHLPPPTLPLSTPATLVSLCSLEIPGTLRPPDLAFVVPLWLIL